MFDLESRVALTKTQNNLLGTVVAVYSNLIYMYHDPEVVIESAKQWAEMANVTPEEILNQNIYMIKLDKPMIPFPKDQIEECRKKFPHEEIFNAWIESKKTKLMSTFEGDLVLSSNLFPDVLPEGI